MLEKSSDPLPLLDDKTVRPECSLHTVRKSRDISFKSSVIGDGPAIDQTEARDHVANSMALARRSPTPERLSIFRSGEDGQDRLRSDPSSLRRGPGRVRQANAPRQG